MQQLYWLASYLLSWIQNHSSLSFSVTAGRAAFLTPSFCALQDVLLHWQNWNSTLWPPRASIIQHHIDCSTSKTLRLQRKITLDSVDSATPVKSWWYKQRNGCSSDWLWRGGICRMETACSKSGLCFISIPAKAMEKYCLCPANTFLVCHEHHLWLGSHTETTFVPMSTGQEILHSTKPVLAQC